MYYINLNLLKKIGSNIYIIYGVCIYSHKKWCITFFVYQEHLKNSSTNPGHVHPGYFEHKCRRILVPEIKNVLKMKET